MNNSNHHNRNFHACIGCIVAVLIVAGLFVDNTVLAWAVVGLLGLDALYLTLRHGSRWWKGNQSKIALREKYLTFLASLMFLFLMTGTALFMQAFIYESQTKPSADAVPLYSPSILGHTIPSSGSFQARPPSSPGR